MHGFRNLFVIDDILDFWYNINILKERYFDFYEIQTRN